MGHPRSPPLDYYIGSLLLWKGKKENFAALSCEPIHGYEGNARPEYIVLDGQRRALLFFCAPMAAEAAEESLQHRLASIAGTRVESLHLSADGSFVFAVVHRRDAAYTDEFIDAGHRSLLHIDVANGRTRRLATDCDDVRRAAVSPDGRRVAHFARRSGKFGVAIRTVQNDVMQQWIELTGEGANAIGEVADLLWSDSGKNPVVVHDPRRSWRERFLRRMTVSASQLPSPIVIDSESARPPLLSAQGFDGSFFVENKERLLVVDAKGATRHLAWQPEGEVRLLRFTGTALTALVESKVIELALGDHRSPRWWSSVR